MFKEGLSKFLKLDTLMENLSGYVETRIELMKYDLKEDLTKLISQVSILAGLLLVGFFVLFFMSTAVAMAIGERLGYFAGFGIVSGFYIILGTVLFANRESLGNAIELKIKNIIKQKKK